MSSSSHGASLFDSKEENEEPVTKLGNYELVASLIERELSNISLANCHRNISSACLWEYQCQYMTNKKIENLIAGVDLQSRGYFSNQIIFEREKNSGPGLQERDIQKHDIFIRSGIFISLINDLLLHHDVRISKKYFETNTYSTTLKLGIRLRPLSTQPSLSDNQSSRRNKVFIKFRESLLYLANVIRKEREEEILISHLMADAEFPHHATDTNFSNSGPELKSTSVPCAVQSENIKMGMPKESISNETQRLYELVFSLSEKVNKLEQELATLRELINSNSLLQR